MPKLVIDGQTVEVPLDRTVLEASAEIGIRVPTLCHHADLTPAGSCRLCLVEVEGSPHPQPACSLPVVDGMVVRTETDELVKARKFVLELLAANYHESGEASLGRDDTEFIHWLRHYQVVLRDNWAPELRHPIDSDPNPFVRIDLNKCILCTLCVRACEEVQGRDVLGVGGRGHEAKIIAGLDTTMLDARCESCGACAAYCPTGALDDRMSLSFGKPDRLVRTTCGYCGVGCQFDLNIKDEHVVRVTSNDDAPVNGMSLCVKGRYGYDYIHHEDRLIQPRVRQYLLDGIVPKDRPRDRGAWVDVDWETALSLVTRRLVDVKRESGPDAIGVFSSAKCTNEENYLMQKFARQIIGTNNIDHCARLCHSSTVAGLAMAFGSGAMSNSMDDVVQEAEAILIIGSNTTEQHPVFGTMIRQAVRRRGVKLVVADPRKIDITEFATQHLRQNPGTDVALINGIAHVAIENNWQDQDFIDQRCEGFEDYRSALGKYTPSRVSEITGIPIEAIQEAAELLCRNRPMAVIWAMGITQHTTGVLNVLSLANLQMLLGNMGVAGGGVNPLRGQNNVQGACDMGALPNVFPGYQPVADEAVRAKFGTAWALAPIVENGEPASPRGMSMTAGLTVTEMVDAAGEGTMRVLYILGEDPAMTEPDSNRVRQCLEAAEFVVLQEIFPSETARFADILLPGASFAEKSGTFTNTDRRIQPVRQAIEPLGAAKPDWQITADLANRVLEEEGRQAAGSYAQWHYDKPADILREIASVTPSYAGVLPQRVESGERLQWPVRDALHSGTPILHVDQFTRGKGKFHVTEHLPARELPDDDYPFVLTTGRVLYHWHGGELSRRAAGLLEVCPEPAVEVSPDDALRLGIHPGDWVRLKSRRGEMKGRAIVTDRVAAGVVFGNFHFAESGNVNNLTIAALDPVAKIPEYKVCAVALESLTET